MAKTFGNFTYELYAPEKGDMPFRAIVKVCLSEFGTDKAGTVFISPQLMHEGEIDWYIEHWKKELDKLGRDAKRALKRANEKTLADLQERRGSEEGDPAPN